MRNCPICCREFANFLPLPAHYFETANKLQIQHSMDDYETLNLGQYLCPFCVSSDRDRLYALYINRLLRHEPQRALRILDIAPAQGLSQFLRKLTWVQYRSADLHSSLAEERVDITDMRVYPDHSFDLVVCSHVLEHVRDDGAAIRELHRVLAPHGTAILMVPILLTVDTTDEDPDEPNADERVRRFGQDDHVRQYAKADFVARLERGGFAVQQVTMMSFGPDHVTAATIFRSHGIAERSVLYIGTRHPDGAAELEPPATLPERVSALPRVTIAIPAYKYDYFEEALTSALAQDYPCVEVLVCDDSSGESIWEIVQRYQTGIAQGAIRYARNASALGEEGNVARCIELAKGEYIKLLYDDDVLRPTCVGRLVDALQSCPEAALASSRRSRIDERGDVLPDLVATAEVFASDTRIHGADLVSFLANQTVNIVGEPSCVLFRRKQALPFLEDGLFALAGQDIEWVGDLSLYAKLLQSGDLILLADKLSSFRVSSTQTSQLVRETPDLGSAGITNFQRALRSLGWHGNYRGIRIASLAESSQFQLFDLWQRLDELRGFSTRSAPLPAPLADLRLWLQKRILLTKQRELIDQQLAINAHNFSILILIRDPNGDAQGVSRTLDSIQGLCSPALPIETTVLSEAQETMDAQARKDLLMRHNVAAAASRSPWLLCLEAGEIIVRDSLSRVAIELSSTPGIRAAFADELIQLDDGRLGSLFRPDFNLDMLLSCPAGLARHWLFRRDVFLEAGGFDPAYSEAPEFELLLRLIEIEGIGGLGHISEPMVIAGTPPLATNAHELAAIEKHLQARDYVHASVSSHLPGRYQIHYGHGAKPLVSIIIPTKDQFAMVERCVSSLLEKTVYQNYEILLVDNNSTNPAACSWLDGLAAMNDARIRVLRYPHSFNYSAINNMAATHARGDYLVLLNNDTAILRGDWLDALLNHAQRPEVGIVGAKLLYPNGTIQHAGVVLGLRGPAEHPFNGVDASEPGYMHRLEVDQNYNAVTGACLMVRRSLYEEVGGLDENDFKVSYNDVDLCLKVRDAGYLIVWTPHSVVLHEGSVSQKQVDTAAIAAKTKRFEAEQDAMYRKWLPVIARDTAYNQNLSLHGAGFEVETELELNWNPLSWRPLPVVLAMAGDQQGCGHYRIIHPGRSIADAGLADVRLSGRHYSPAELERMSPDSWIIQRQVTDEQIELIRRNAQFTKAFKVAELDDYLPNLPMKNAHRTQMPKDILRALRRSVSLADRFVVSTEPLAEALAGLNSDTRVVLNRLPPAWWRGLQSNRRQSSRPRVGWAGGSSHQGDLELIIDVVKELKGEVDWVFFGMCPEQIRPYLHEFHGPVPIERYPRTLASLNLDLALAPLEQNLFNECKSNLRLLEYGACGYPVVCSDVRPYQGRLPVTLVKNRFKDWVAAIRSHTHDLDAASRAGDRLKAEVEQHWMLEGENLKGWLKAWLPD